MLASWVRSAPADAIEFARENGEIVSEDDVLARWGESDPSAAFAKAVELDRHDVLVTNTLARKDPAEAFALWRSANPAGKYSATGAAIFTEMANLDLPLALAKSAELPGTTNKWTDFAILKVWSQSEPFATLEWLNSHPDTPSSGTGVVDALVKTEVSKLLDFLPEIDRSGLRKDVVRSLGNSWVRTDRESAINYAMSESAAPDVRSKIVAHAAPSLWYDGEAAQAFELMNSDPTAPVAAEIARIIRTNNCVSLDDARKFASILEDEDSRRTIMAAINQSRH